ncbi:CCA tRNA nucleotidyltransferase, partial [bacterium]|nr:CCA tRNA nucleotidyltransferase [bacterium]
MPLLIMNNTERVAGPGASHLLADISRFLTGKGIAAYVVGGCVRDALQHRATADIDIAVNGDAVPLAPLLARYLGATPVTLDAENRISRIVLPDHTWEIDLTSFSGSIEEDLARRDFTIDAIAYPLDETIEAGIDAARCIDPFHGRDDLRRGIVRAVSDTVFTEDPARLLRAVRIAAELGFSIDPETEDLIRRDSRCIEMVAGERTREEFLRLLARPGAGERLFQLDNLGLLTALIPELAPARGTDQPVIHVWDVLEHSIRTVTAVEFVLHEGSWDHAPGDVLSVVPWSGELREHFDEPVSHGSTRRTLLKLAALLHDIGKP